MATKKPNILILWGDDIGIWNISHFSRGMMGYRTPNIDRIAEEGVTFTDYYAQQSCTAGRACFIAGQNPIRTGLTKVGMPGATVGLQKEDPTIAEMLKPLGYATGQFGKNHLGDRDEYLPTVHGFDEFFGNLYHLNAEEEPELPDYPKDPAFKKQFGPRGVLHCIADGKGGQTIKDTGPADEEAHGDDRRGDHGAGDRVDGEAGQGGQAVLPLVQLDGDALPHPRRREEPRQERAGSLQRSHGRPRRADRRDPREARRAGHRRQHHRPCTRPTTAPRTTPGRTAPTRRSAVRRTPTGKAAGACRAFMRWPGKIKAGSVLNGIVSHIDMFPTLLAAAGDPDVTKQLLDGTTVGDKTFKVHLDGYNMVPYLTGEVKESPRNALIYFSDDGDVMAVRVGDYKFNLAVQRANQMQQWAEPFVKLRVPHIVNLRRDPFERADFNSNTYWDWMVDHVPADVPDAGSRGVGDRGLRQVPAAPEAGIVQPRRGDGAGAEPQAVTHGSRAIPADDGRPPGIASASQNVVQVIAQPHVNAQRGVQR